MTKRQALDNFKGELKAINADNNYSNQFLYNELLKQAKWLIKREVSGGRIYTNNSLFQPIKCMEVIEVSAIDECCPIKTNCKIYRTKSKLPEAWIDNSGPILRKITSVDSSTDFHYITPTTWRAKSGDPYQKMGKNKYTFFSDNYLWFPENNPHFIRLEIYALDKVKVTDACAECVDEVDCTPFLDTPFMIPGWLEGECFSKALVQMLQLTERLQSDNQVDKNTTRKN